MRPDFYYPAVPSCNNSPIALVVNSTSGITVQISSLSSSYNITIDNLFLPSECGVNYQRCNLTVVENTFLIIPAIRNLIFLSLECGSLQEPIVVPINANCNPTNIFIDEENRNIWTACLSDSSLIYVPFTYSVNQTIVVEEPYNPQLIRPLRGSRFSESVIVYQPTCNVVSDLNIYVLADNYFWYFATRSSPAFTEAAQLPNECTDILYIDHSRENLFLTLYCMNGVTVTYDVCDGSTHSYFLSEEGLPFYCSSKTVFYKNDEIRVINSIGTVLVNHTHTIGEVQYGKCQNDYFIFITKNGSLFSFQFNTSILSLVAGSVCDSEGNSCVRPSFKPFSSGFVIFDTLKNSLMSVNIFGECEGPVVEVHDVHVTPYPFMISVLSLPNMSYNHTCQCTTIDNTNKTTTEVKGITETTTSTEGHSTEGTSEGHPTEGTSNSTAGTSDSKLSIGVAVAIAVTATVVGSAAVFVVILVVLW